MDVATKICVKVEVRDCVSMRVYYWGKPFTQKLKEKHNIEKLFGQVQSVINNSDFSVVWDNDQGVDQRMSLGKCNYEPQDTLLQRIPEEFTSDDFQGAEQSTSSHWINQEHELVVEDFEACVAEDVDLCEGTKYVLTHQLYKIFEVKLIKSTAGALVHNKPLEYYQRRFEITGVMKDIIRWPDYDDNFHMRGPYIAWSISST